MAPFKNYNRRILSHLETDTKYLIYVFYAEVLLSIASVAQTLFTPEKFLLPFSSDVPSTVAVIMTRWYGVVLSVLLYLLARGLWLRGAALKLALESLLVGDVVQIIVAFGTARVLGAWASNVMLALVVSVVLGIVRIVCLWKPVATGIERRAKLGFGYNFSASYSNIKGPLPWAQKVYLD